MSPIWTWFITNWKSNVIATVAIVYSATQFVTAIQAWENHQPANWRAAIVSLIVAALGYVAKDASTHSTSAQVTQATMKANGGK
jgi:uncharacterized membrane protein YfcA